MSPEIDRAIKQALLDAYERGARSKMEGSEVRIPYAAVSEAERRESLDALLDPQDGWPRDWEDRLGLDAKGSIIWQVNAADVMLLVREIHGLRQQMEAFVHAALDEPNGIDLVHRLTERAKIKLEDLASGGSICVNTNSCRQN